VGISNKKVSLEEAQNRLYDKHGNSIVLLEYRSMGDYATFKCAECDRIWETRAYSIINLGRGCEKCSNIKRAESSRKTFDDFVKTLYKNHGNALVLLEYLSLDEDANFECTVCGHNWWGMASSVIYGMCGCPECKKRETFSKKEKRAIDKLYETHGDSITLLEYNGNRSDCLFECNECGNKWYSDGYSVIVAGHGCSVCSHQKGGQKLSEQLTIPEEEIIDCVVSYGCEFIGFPDGYLNSTSKIMVLFSCGHEGTLTIQSFKQRKYKKLCQNCSIDEGNKLKCISEDDVIAEIEAEGFEFMEFPNGYDNGASLVSYKCSEDHITTRSIRYFRTYPTCEQCTKTYMSESQRGEKSFRWKGGRTDIKRFLSKHLTDWKKESMINCNYRCFVTGEVFDEIHHLYSMTAIIMDTLVELELPLYETMGSYTQEEISFIINKFQEIHFRHPLGVCLRRDVHTLFHNIYGRDGDTTPDQFYDFLDRIESGEITIHK
jgi:hypothetical protein